MYGRKEPAIRGISIQDRNLDSTFLMADFHFDHDNIIKYCSRPFPDSEAMNRHMLQKYSSVVGYTSLFIFLGDMTFGRQSRGARYWLRHLRGEKIYVKGSHDLDIHVSDDDPDCRMVCDELILHTSAGDLLCIHAPEQPCRRDLWILHGHHHNKFPEKYPFLHPVARSMNLSAEMVDYTPVSLSRILLEIKKVGTLQPLRKER